MKISKDAQWKNHKQTRFNRRLLTEVREDCSQQIPTQWKSGNLRTTRANEMSNVSMSKKTIGSLGNIIKRGVWLGSGSNSRSWVVKKQLQVHIGKLEEQQTCNSKSSELIKLLQTIFTVGEYINDNFYSYKIIENSIRILNQKIKQLQSLTSQFYSYTISALILYQYSSFSLTIFYFDKALKALSIKNIYKFDTQLQLSIYKYASKVFLQIKKIKQAKDMAYMYLRKAWKYKNVDEQFSAYDLLGQVQLEEGNIQLSRYFHWRMCHAVREQKQILQMSNQELEKNQHKHVQFSIFEDIMQFVRSQQQIVSILSNHFRSQAEQQKKGFRNRGKSKQIFMYTHRSPNRVLRNHRVLQRRLIDQKQSIQLHFIRLKDIKRLRKIITEFNCFIFDVKRLVEVQLCADQTNVFD